MTTMRKALLHLLLPVLLAQAGGALAAETADTAPAAIEPPQAPSIEAVPEAEPAPDAAPAPDPAELAAQQQRRRELLQQKERIEARIEELQQQGGVYAADLQESWFELGDTLQALEAWDEATQAYDSAWQATRISGGLNDPLQLPALRRLFAAQRAAEEWEKVDTTAHLMQHISSKAFAPGSAERLDAVLQLGRWKLLAARDDLLPNAFGVAMNASEVYGSEIAKLEALDDYPGRNIQLATLHLEKASAEFLLANEIRQQPLQEYFVSGQRSNTVLQCSVTRLPDGRAQQICVPVEIPNLDFYVDPANRKNQDIMRHLGEMRSGVEAAWNLLKDETENTEARDALLADMNALTESYNSFVTGNRL
jgi:DNA-binding transcriptional MerR regulator